MIGMSAGQRSSVSIRSADFYRFFKVRTKRMGKKNFLLKHHPEANIDGTTVHEGAVAFYSLVKAAILQVDAKKVLNFGAGRGRFWYTNDRETGSLLRKSLQDLRAPDLEITACDIDPIVLTNPVSDYQVQIFAGQALPFEDDSFDIIVSDMTVEHIDQPKLVCDELLRVLRPGGFICVRTPNKWGYVALAAMLVPNALHAKALTLIQGGRAEKDVFPTYYRINTRSDFQKFFPRQQVYVTKHFSNPEYYFGSHIVYAAFRFLHWMLPSAFAPTLFAFIRKSA